MSSELTKLARLLNDFAHDPDVRDDFVNNTDRCLAHYRISVKNIKRVKNISDIGKLVTEEIKKEMKTAQIPVAN